MIDKEALQEMFDNIRAQTDWKIDGPMLWGYFFTDRQPEKLEAIVPVFEAQGYRYVDIFEPVLEEEQGSYFFLHVEKEETHSVESLNERNQQLYAFAELHDIDTYDGMDVGPLADL